MTNNARNPISSEFISGANLRVNASAAYPFFALSPAIDVSIEYQVEFDGYTGHGRVRAIGTTDLFPAYEVFVQDRLIASYTPESNGPNAFNLTGARDFIGEWTSFQYVSEADIVI